MFMCIKKILLHKTFRTFSPLMFVKFCVLISVTRFIKESVMQAEGVGKKCTVALFVTI